MVTGATGFVGQVLVAQLSTAGYRVTGISEQETPPKQITELLANYYCADLVSGWPDVDAFDGIVHLAGLAAVGPSFERPQQYLNHNSAMVTNLFEYLLRRGWKGRAIVVSSGAVYSTVEGEFSAFTEDSRTGAASPYVVSKMLIENQTEYYRGRGIDAFIARPFNHIGPGQGPGFIVPDLTRKVLDLELGRRLAVGNLDSARDYTDVRDIVRAYQRLLEVPQLLHAKYNVCSGSARSGWQVLHTVCKVLGRPTPPTTRATVRPIDPLLISGDAGLLKGETNWEPKIDFETSIRDFVDSRLESPQT